MKTAPRKGAVFVYSGTIVVVSENDGGQAQ